MQNYDEGTNDRPYPHALVVGIDKYPGKIVRKLSKKKLNSRMKVKPFVKIYNYNHLLPTRYALVQRE